MIIYVFINIMKEEIKNIKDVNDIKIILNKVKIFYFYNFDIDIVNDLYISFI